MYIFIIHFEHVTQQCLARTILAPVVPGKIHGYDEEPNHKHTIMLPFDMKYMRCDSKRKWWLKIVARCQWASECIKNNLEMKAIALKHVQRPGMAHYCVVWWHIVFVRDTVDWGHYLNIKFYEIGQHFVLYNLQRNRTHFAEDMRR